MRRSLIMPDKTNPPTLRRFSRWETRRAQAATLGYAQTKGRSRS
ncbi:hypothetical protein [Chamaesiphon minutus]|nr:hypothetical protein [Chamaesiphon minutus]